MLKKAPGTVELAQVGVFLYAARAAILAAWWGGKSLYIKSI
jgi:hypothetical protein